MCYCNSKLNEFSFDPLLQFLKFLYVLQMMKEILEFDSDEDIKKKQSSRCQDYTMMITACIPTTPIQA